MSKREVRKKVRNMLLSYCGNGDGSNVYDASDIMMVFAQRLDDATDAIAVAASDPSFINSADYAVLLAWQEIVHGVAEEVCKQKEHKDKDGDWL